jgi:hypothetical protein
MVLFGAKQWKLNALAEDFPGRIIVFHHLVGRVDVQVPDIGAFRLLGAEFPEDGFAERTEDLTASPSEPNQQVVGDRHLVSQLLISGLNLTGGQWDISPQHDLHTFRPPGQHVCPIHKRQNVSRTMPS